MTPEMVMAAGVALFSSPLVAVGYWVADRWRSRRRNAAEQCGSCTGPLYAPGSLAGPSLVEGVLHCAPCAERLRGRVRAGFAAVGVWAAAVSAFSVVGLVMEGVSFIPIAGLVVAEVSLIGGGTFAFMRRKNQRALRAMEARGEILPPAPASEPAPATGVHDRSPRPLFPT